MTKISVIIPVYNAETTIERCLSSLIEYESDVEIVCVDDGSSDNTYNILKEYECKRKNMVVISQGNQGPSVARNCGLKVAKSEYIMFCDSDDKYDKNVIPNMLNIITKDYDYIVFKRANCYANGNIIQNNQKSGRKEIFKTWHDYLNEDFIQSNHSVAVINKVYKKSIIDTYDIWFDPQLELSEDFMFNLLYIPRCESFYENNDAVYLRYLQDGSLTRKPMESYYDTETFAIHYYIDKWPFFSKLIPNLVNHTICNSVINALNRYCMGLDGASLFSRLRMMKKLTKLSEFRKASSEIVKAYEGSIFLRQLLIAQKGYVLFYYLYYGTFKTIGRRIKKLLQVRA